MRKLKKLLMVVMALVVALGSVSAFGCGGGTGTKEGELRIVFYEGGFGRDWLVHAADDFVAKKAAEGVTITYKLEGSPSSIKDDVKTYLTSGKNLADIYMTQGGDWSGYVTGGYLADLDSVYDAEVEKLDGTKITVKDYMLDEISDKPYMKRRAGQGQSHAWVMPWSLLETSIIYNEDLLKQVPKSGTDGKWENPPETMEELASLCADINAAQLKAGSKTVAPFAWSYGGINYFEFIIQVLWAQHQGVYDSLIDGQGAYYDFWNFDSPDVWKQTGIKTAIDEWRSIIVKDGAWANSIGNVEQITLSDAAYAFSKGEAVMMLGGSFFENENKASLDKDDDGKSDYTFKMMYVPFGSGTLQQNEDNSGNAKINYCSTDDIMFVPAKAVNKELAKEFLTFLCNEKYLLDFSKETGCVRPFKYNPVELAGEDYEWSEFFLSCFNMQNKADFNIFTYPMNAAKKGEVSLYYTYFQPALFTSPGVASAMQSLREKDGATLMAEVLEGSTRKWNDWKTTLGI